VAGAAQAVPDVPWRLGWGPRWLDRALLAAIVAGAALWIVVGPVTKVPRHIDEGLHAVGARYFLLDPADQVARPDYYVGGWSDWGEGAYTLLYFPPAPDVLYGLSIGAFGLGPAGFGLPLLLAGLLTALALYALGRQLWDRTTGLAAAALFLWSEAALREGSQLEAEAPLTALGTLAVAAVALGTARRHWGWFAAAGAAFGAAFLLKLYMGLFPGLVTVGFLVWGLRAAPGVESRLRVLGRWAVLAGTTAAVGLSHLAWLALTRPETLSVWEFVYVRSLVERAGVAGTAPVWYYPALLYRDFAPLVVPLLWAAAELFHGRARRDADEGQRRWLVGTTAASILALFAFSKKESAYLYPLVPFVVLFAGRGLTGLARFAAAPDRRPRALLAGAALCVAAVAGLVGLWLVGFRPTGLDLPFLVLHTVTVGALGAAFVWWRRGRTARAPRLAVAVVAGAALAWGAAAGVDIIAAHASEPLRAQARLLSADPARVEVARPPDAGSATPTFVSTYWQPLSAFLWQNGRPWYWDADGERPWRAQALGLEPSVRFFQIDKEYRWCSGCPPTPVHHAEVLAWLRRTADDLTPQLEAELGRPIGTFVFRRRPTDAAQAGAEP
jgi:4-amino-4-deoxy-L-arabinose transferase-like glycosyltransferase